MKYLNLAWRFVGTAVLWFFFGVFGLLLNIFVFPLVYVLYRQPDRRQVVARSIISSMFGLFVWGGPFLGVFTCRVTGMEHRNPDRGQLILANHPTLIDVVILLSVLPQVDCVIKHAVIRNPVMRAQTTSARYLSNKEPDELLDSCVERLQSGASLLLFPEGTRSIPGEPLQFKLGAAEIAIRARAEILPVVIEVRPAVLAKKDPWYRIPPSRPHFELTMLPPVKVEDLVEGDIDERHSRHKVSEALLSLFATELA